MLPAVARADSVPPFTPDATEVELTRLLNMERVRNGLEAIVIDPWLSFIARDGDIACPGAPGQVMHGRAKDTADYWAPETFSAPNDPHALRLCPGSSVLDVMNDSWGYTGSSAEIFAWNGGTSNDMSDRHYPATCGGTPSCYDHGPSMVVLAASSFMDSPGHRAVVLDPRYTHFGCGAAVLTANSQYLDMEPHYFMCVYSSSGGSMTAPARTPSPIPTPTPVPTASPTPAPKMIPTDTIAPTIRWRSNLHTGRRVFVRVTLSDNVGVTSVRLMIDGRIVARWSPGGARSTTKSFTRRLVRGRHVIAWYVTDLAGHTRTSRTTVRLR